MLIAGILVVSTMVGGTLAALNTNTENGVGAAKVNIGVNAINVEIEKGETASQDVDIDVPATLPGGEYNCSYKITNGADGGYDIYAKVVINKYWTEISENDNADQLIEGTYAGLSGNEFADVCIADSTGKSRTVREITSYEQQYEINDWIVTYADDEQIVMYYKYPISKGDVSTNFIDAISFDKKMGNEYADKEYHLNIEVTVVQENSAEDAIAAELGVFPVFDENGVITWINEVR